MYKNFVYILIMLQYKNFTAKIHYINRSNSFYGEVMHNNCLIHCQAAEQITLIEAFQDAVDQYLLFLFK